MSKTIRQQPSPAERANKAIKAQKRRSNRHSSNIALKTGRWIDGDSVSYDPDPRFK